jgi:hypothetical protein
MCTTWKQETRGTPDELCMSYGQQRAVDILFKDAGLCAAGNTEFETSMLQSCVML